MLTGKRLWCLVGALMMVGLGACSSSSKGAATSSTSSGTGTPSSSAQPTGTPIKVGYICSCSGSPLAGEVVGIEETYKAWVDTVNSSGGIEGHPVQVIYDDDASNPGNSLSDAKSLISQHVVALVDNTVLDSTWASAAQAAHIPVVGTEIGSLPFLTNSDFYPEAETADANFYSIAAVAKLAGATNIGVLYCAEAAECAQTVSAVQAAGSQVGVPDVYNSAISATAPNYTSQCLAAQQKHVSALFIGDEAPIILNVVADCARQGYNPIYVQLGETYAASMASASGMKNNLWLASEVTPFFSQIPAVQTMNAAVDKYYPGLRQNANLWTENAEGAWVSGLLLEDALKAGGLTPSGTPTAGALIQGLQSLHGDTLQGMAPPITFSPGKPHLVDCWSVQRLVNGVPTLLNNGQYTCKSGSSG